MLGDGREDGVELRVVERRPAVEREQRAVAAKDRRLADLQVDVARAGLDGAQKHGVEIHSRS